MSHFRIVFERGAFDAAAIREVAWALLFLSLGIAIFTMRDLISRAFFTLQDTITPMIIGVISVCFNIVMNLLLVGPLEQGGLTLATTLSALVGLVLSILALQRKTPAGFPYKSLLSSIARTASASIIMGVSVWWVYPKLGVLLQASGTLMEFVQVLVASGIGAAIYLLLVWILRVPELDMIWNMAMNMMRRFLHKRQQPVNS